MQNAERRQLLVSKGWVQAVLLVVLFGFFVLGLLAYRTYQAKPPTPQRFTDPAGHRALHGGRHPQGPAGVPPQRSHGVRLGVRSRRLPRSGLHRGLPAPLVGLRHARKRRRGLRSRKQPDDPRVPDQPLRQAHGHGGAERRAGRGPPAPGAALQRLLLRADHEARAAAQRHHGPRPATAADGLLRLDGMGGLDRAAGPQLLLHQQLASRAARRQQADGERDRLERAVADRAARRDRDPLRRLRALALPRMARTRAGHAVVPRSRRRRADAGATGVRVVLLRDGGAVPDPDARRRRVAALSRGARHRSSGSTSLRSSPTT